jgi:hypothetical protein
LHFVLQEKGCAAGDHVVRARGAWFGNRSISAEVDLEVGIYEVLPKIEASRDADAPAVEEVVVKVAERNPQKLRQIGLNYDIANAKGANELTEEQKKKHEQKKKEAVEKKKKKAEEDAKEKEDFENWKKEEKADYEAWKRERARQAKAAPKEDVGKSDTKDDDSKPENKDDEIKIEKRDNEAKGATKSARDEPVDVKVEAPTPPTAAAVKTDEAEEIKIGAPSPSTVAEETPRVNDEATTTEPNKNDTNLNPKPKDNSNYNETRLPPDTDDVHLPHYAVSHGPPSMLNGPGPYSRHPGSVYGDPAPPAPRSTHGAADSTPKTWNAVCVLGLRVYSQDPSVSIKLVKPKDVEEGAILDVDGDTMAGATM